MRVTETEDYKALYATVLAHPAADVPRLVLADYLEEQGEATYAEFIRLQVELAGMGQCVCECRNRIDFRCQRCATESRVGELWAKLVGVWDFGCFGHRYETDGFVVQPSFHTFRSEDRAFRLHRGFIDEVTCPLEWWVGPACAECGGDGEIFDGYDRSYGCRACGGESVTKYGSGRDGSKANGPKVVRDHPVAKVTLSDNDGWCHEVEYEGGARNGKDWIVTQEVVPGTKYTAWFDSYDEGVADTSSRLLAWAREESAE